MNIIDKVATALSPSWALKRAAARHSLRLYEAAKPNRKHKKRGDTLSGNEVTGNSTEALRILARDYEQNYDVVRGILSALVNNTVGTGLRLEPMIEDQAGNLLIELNEEIEILWTEWGKCPEVTCQLNWEGVQRLVARSWYRDGEVFWQYLEGNVAALDHFTEVPYSIELIESDLIPSDFENSRENIKFGVQKNAWGRIIAYQVLFEHPGSLDFGILQSKENSKLIPATRMGQLILPDRIRQSRGVSCLASVLNRLDDIRDFEESERLAARIAAAQVMAITKSSEGQFNQNTNDDRLFEIKAGTVWDNLLPGEEPKILSSDRPNNQMDSYVSGQLKRIASGTDTNYSTIARDYQGSYSSQRQSLVEAWQAYLPLRKHFAQRFSQPTYEKFLRMAIVAGIIKIPATVNLRTLNKATWCADPMPWIDPEKEYKAEKIAVENKFKSHKQVIRDRGNKPEDVLKEEAAFEKMAKELGLTLVTTAPVEVNDDQDDQNDNGDGSDRKLIAEDGDGNQYELDIEKGECVAIT